MGRDKFEFIKSLLESEKLTVTQKARIISLTGKELLTEKSDDRSLDDRLNKIEERLLIFEKLKIEHEKTEIGSLSKAESDTKIVKKDSIVSKTFYIYPQNASEFLSTLNQNLYTKYLTHSIDHDDKKNIEEALGTPFIFSTFLQSMKDVFDALTDENKSFEQFSDLKKITISKNLYAKVKNYIFGLGPWGETKCLENWSHNDITKWCDLNPEKVPTPGEDFNYEGAKIGNKLFSDTILLFKNEVHLRAANSLRLIVNKIFYNPDNKLNKSIKLENSIDDRLEIFTDVEKVKQVIRSIFKLIIEKKDSPVAVVSITNIFRDNKIIVSILARNTVMHNTKETFRIGNSTLKIMKNCNGICDLILSGKFSDGKCYNLQLWGKGMEIINEQTYMDRTIIIGPEIISETTASIEGVQFNLVFG